MLDDVEIKRNVEAELNWQPELADDDGSLVVLQDTCGQGPSDRRGGATRHRSPQ